MKDPTRLTDGSGKPVTVKITLESGDILSFDYDNKSPLTTDALNSLLPSIFEKYNQERSRADSQRAKTQEPQPTTQSTQQQPAQKPEETFGDIVSHPYSTLLNEAGYGLDPRVKTLAGASATVLDSIMGTVVNAAKNLAEAVTTGVSSTEKSVSELFHGKFKDSVKDAVKGGVHSAFLGGMGVLNAYQLLSPSGLGWVIGSGLTEKAFPKVSDAIQTISTPITSIFQPKSQFRRDIAGIFDVGIDFLALHSVNKKLAKTAMSWDKERQASAPPPPPPGNEPTTVHQTWAMPIWKALPSPKEGVFYTTPEGEVIPSKVKPTSPETGYEDWQKTLSDFQKQQYKLQKMGRSNAISTAQILDREATQIQSHIDELTKDFQSGKLSEPAYKLSSQYHLNRLKELQTNPAEYIKQRIEAVDNFIKELKENERSPEEIEAAKNLKKELTSAKRVLDKYPLEKILTARDRWILEAKANALHADPIFTEAARRFHLPVITNLEEAIKVGSTASSQDILNLVEQARYYSAKAAEYARVASQISTETAKNIPSDTPQRIFSNEAMKKVLSDASSRYANIAQLAKEAVQEYSRQQIKDAPHGLRQTLAQRGIKALLHTYRVAIDEFYKRMLEASDPEERRKWDDRLIEVQIGRRRLMEEFGFDPNEGNVGEHKQWSEEEVNRAFKELGIDATPEDPQQTVREEVNKEFTEPKENKAMNETLNQPTSNLFRLWRKLSGGTVGKFKDMMIKHYVEETGGAKSALREVRARRRMSERMFFAAEIFARGRKTFNQMSPEDGIAFIQRISQGQYKPEDFKDIADKYPTNKNITAEELATYAQFIHQSLDEMFHREKKEGASEEEYRQHYFPMIFKSRDTWEKMKPYFILNENLNPEEMMKSMGSEKFKATKVGGKRGFEMHRLVPELTDEFLKDELISTNPFDVLMHRKVASERMIEERAALQLLREWGYAKEVPANEIPPDQYQISTQRTVKETTPDGKIRKRQYVTVAPKEVAELINRWRDPGLWGNKGLPGKIFRGWMTGKGISSSLVLTLSAYHGVMTYLSGVTSELVRSYRFLQKAAKTRDLSAVKEAAKYAVGSPINPIKNAVTLGNQLRKFYYGKVSNPELAEMWETLLKAGVRVGMPGEIESTNIRQQLSDAFEKLKGDAGLKAIPEGALDMLGGLARLVSYPIMEYWVPNLKLASTIHAIRDWEMIHPHATEMERRVAYGHISDEMDNRFGQLNYDNLFWHKSLKHIFQATTLSLGWNLGTIRGLMYGTVKDALYAAPTGDFSDRLLFSMIYPIVVGIAGSLIHYANTGKAPESIQDVYTPQDGSGGRLLLPTEWKEFLALGARVIEPLLHGNITEAAEGVGVYATSKLAPLFSDMASILTNKTYMNTEIYDRFAPIHTQIWQTAQYFLGQNLPISIRNILRERENLIPGHSSDTIGKDLLKIQFMNLLGINPAPKYMTNDYLTNLIEKTANLRSGGTMSYGTQERIDAERAIKSAYNRYKATQDPKDKETVQQLLQNAAKSNLFTPRQLQNLVKKLRMSPEDTKHQLFKRLPADDQISIAQYMTKEQLKEFWQFFNQSTMEQLRNPQNSAARKLRERLLELKNESQR